eukprot:513861-Hanusia_phi.AAC.1
MRGEPAAPPPGLRSVWNFGTRNFGNDSPVTVREYRSSSRKPGRACARTREMPEGPGSGANESEVMNPVA